MKAKKASKLLLQRLELYLQYLKTLPETVTHVSATTIAQAIDLGDVQVRKDLARVSSGGRKKTGHIRSQLIRDVEYFLAFGVVTNAVLVGAGKLGQALLIYSGFEKAGIRLLAGFDIYPADNASACEKPIYSLDQLGSFCENHNIHIGIITVPPESAQEVCDLLISCGIEAIWNFAPITLHVPEHVLIQNENLAISARALQLQLHQQKQTM